MSNLYCKNCSYYFSVRKKNPKHFYYLKEKLFGGPDCKAK